MVTQSRIEVQTRMSEPYGHSKDDREGNISFLLVQLCKDIAIVREASMKATNDRKREC
jgi:hypothetical protein